MGRFKTLFYKARMNRCKELEADYKHWLVAEIVLPPLEEWRKNVCIFKNFVEMNQKFRAEWDDIYWDAIIHSAPAS
ncbi:hypothetical protein CR513_14126, partial [Mucuna pruriens]